MSNWSKEYIEDYRETICIEDIDVDLLNKLK